jgi:hypothetical protein
VPYILPPPAVRQRFLLPEQAGFLIKLSKLTKIHPLTWRRGTKLSYQHGGHEFEPCNRPILFKKFILLHQNAGHYH